MPDIHFDPLLSADRIRALEPALAAALSAPPRRIQPLETALGHYWLKRVEQHKSMIRRLQKGEAHAAFRLELAAHRRLGALGAPVAPMVAWGAGWMVTPDCGPTVHSLLCDETVSDETRRRALTDAAGAIATLHRMDLRHGRPKLRDICWSADATADRRAVMIDLERFKENATEAERGLDAALFAHSILMVQGGHTPLFDTAILAYRDAAPAACWVAAQRAARRYRLLMPLVRIAARRKPSNRELRAILDLPQALESVMG